VQLMTVGGGANGRSPLHVIQMVITTLLASCCKLLKASRLTCPPQPHGVVVGV
jgi:hypothetical protein